MSMRDSSSLISFYEWLSLGLSPAPPTTYYCPLATLIDTAKLTTAITKIHLIAFCFFFIFYLLSVFN
jgi:hypothetical protein